MAGPHKLSADELAVGVEQLDGWSIVDGKLRREFKFKDFSAAFAFMLRVAMEAHRADHHPEWSNVYNRVQINLVTHEVDGVSERDIDMAKYINALL